MFSNIDDVMFANAKKGNYFFSSKNMGFYNSKIETDLLGNRYFITSEKPQLEPETERIYNVREALDTGEVITINAVGDWFATKNEALEFLVNHLAKEHNYATAQ